MRRFYPYISRDNILFVDTETTGIPLDSSASFKNIDNWPNILQIAWIVYKKEGMLVSSHNYAISNDASSSIVSASGYVPKIILPIHQILDHFLESLSRCNVIVGHNIEYDVTVILCELYRYGKDTDRLSSMQQFCTMKNSVEICGFDTSRGDRYPKLQELYSKLFHQPFDNAHDAYCDIKATADCFWRMFDGGFLNIEDFPYLIDAQKKAQKAKEYSDKAEQALEESKSKVKRKSIYSEACDALGISLISAILDNNGEKMAHLQITVAGGGKGGEVPNPTPSISGTLLNAPADRWQMMGAMSWERCIFTSNIQARIWKPRLQTNKSRVFMVLHTQRCLQACWSVSNFAA